MASGKWNTFLNMIGLVDDSVDDEEALDQYGSGRYGRPSTYVPPRSQSTQSRRSGASSGGGTRSFLPSRSSSANRSNAGSTRRTYGVEDDTRSTNTRRQTASRFEEEPRASSNSRQPFNPSPTSRAHLNDYAPEQQRSSRFEPQPRERDREEPAPRRASAPSANRTVVLNLLNLRDANKVISSLVRGNTIVMTIETDDPMMRQRIVDTLSGAVYALEATIRRASESTYLLAPRDVDVQAAYDADDRF